MMRVALFAVLLASLAGCATVEGVGRDISDRREAEDALRAGEARFRAIFDHAGTGIALANLEGELLQVNCAFRRMLGYSESELLSLSVPNLHPPEEQAEVEDHFRKYADNNANVVPNLAFLRKDGTVFFADVSAKHIEYNGRPCWVGFIHIVIECLHAEIVNAVVRISLLNKGVVSFVGTGFGLFPQGAPRSFGPSAGNNNRFGCQKGGIIRKRQGAWQFRPLRVVEHPQNISAGY